MQRSKFSFIALVFLQLLYLLALESIRDLIAMHLLIPKNRSSFEYYENQSNFNEFVYYVFSYSFYLTE
jgi:hypothetical protein